jgi:hypothetical protein
MIVVAMLITARADVELWRDQSMPHHVVRSRVRPFPFALDRPRAIIGGLQELIARAIVVVEMELF